MKKNSSKIVAIITGFISVLICVLYLILITIFDFRTFLNNNITNLSESMAVIFLKIDNLFLFLF